MAKRETDKQAPKPKCKRCKGTTILIVDNGFHYTFCPDCHPAYREIRGQSDDAPNLEGTTP